MTVQELIDGLNEAIAEDYKERGITCYLDEHGKVRESEKAYLKKGTKFDKINIGGSGAYMVEKSTGELYNTKGYGVADYNKKKKADIGNLENVNPKVLFTKRYNYLR